MKSPKMPFRYLVKTLYRGNPYDITVTSSIKLSKSDQIIEAKNLARKLIDSDFESDKLEFL